METKIVYIASPFAGDIEKNIEKTKLYSRYVLECGFVPFNPILNLLGVVKEETEREVAMNADLAILQRADEVWAFGKPSPGMIREIRKAEMLGKRVRYFHIGKHPSHFEEILDKEDTLND